MNWDDFWSRYSASGRLAKSTLKGYRQNLQIFLNFWAGHQLSPDGDRVRGPLPGQTSLAGPRDVEQRHLLVWYAHEKERPGVAPATAAACLRSVVIVLRWAVRQDLLLVDPTDDLIVPKPSRPIPRILTPDEITSLLEAPLAANRRFIRARDVAIIELLYGTGLRGGELTALDLGDIDLPDRSLAIHGGKGQPRRVPFGERVTQVLQRYLADYRFVCATPDQRAFFVNLRGQRLGPGALNSQLARYGKGLGLVNVTAHALRRAFATHMLENGANIVEIKNLLGHADIDSTVIYTRVFPGELIRSHHRTHPRARRKEGSHGL